ncbi:carbohydrate ABC transporter permease [Stackebrandtia nassauensis]|uniref:Binding-protein-dependent transport systems inner membrane component n=1 Tax=Stackebrandtia nassauensis (strain DSM 44728 / CIP 108903 / NRRL B-16338 / NBRC 102104 / LLR-40K-21) TaxID=446470 RepID=D3PV63_STANL|nr:sugar ABC transporter permease [Stackebrandtia nassauensis]ADD41116.1 binding-protein-dependent transport systems inner membrane component [Stackebrandtia nassauensis DSM 44728]
MQTKSPEADGPAVEAPSHAGVSAVGTPKAKADTDVVGLGRLRAIGFVAPALLLIGVFLLFPALWTLYIGATNYERSGENHVSPDFVGIDNVTKVLGDPAFYHSLWLTLLFVGLSAVLGQNGLGFALAWSLRNVSGWLRRTVETLVLLAWILPSSVVAFLWIAMLDRDGGTVNAVLNTPGLAWLVEYPLASIVIFNIWRGTAFSMMLYGAALSAVPPSHVETARLAGASNAQTLRDVVFPHIRGHILTNTLLITLWTFNDFTPFLLTAGGPGDDTEIAAVYVYKTGLLDGQLGYSGAISLLILLANVVLALVYLRMLRRRNPK